MNRIPPRQLLLNLLAIVLGPAVCFFTLMAFFPLFIYATGRLFPAEDFGQFEPRGIWQAVCLLLLVWAYLLTGGLVGGIACAMISINRERTLSALAGLLLAGAFLLSYRQDIGGYYYNEFWDRRVFTWGNPLLMALAVYAGGLLGRRLKTH